MGTLTYEQCRTVISTKDVDYFAHLEPRSYGHIQEIHRDLVTVITLSAMALNVALIYVVKTQSTDLRKIRGVIMFATCFDLVHAFFSFLLAPMPIASHGMFLGLMNSYVTTDNAYVQMTLKVVISSLSCYSWLTVPLQYVWRLIIVKTGQKPRGPALFGMFLMTTTYALSYTVFSIYLKFNPDPADRPYAQAVANHLGFFAATPAQLSGSWLTEGATLYHRLSSNLNCGLSLLVILACDLAIRREWRRMAAHKAVHARKLFRSLRRTFRCMAIAPIFTNVIPTFVQQYYINSCATEPVLLALKGVLMVLQPLVNAALAFLFIHPYRRFVLRKLRLVSQTNSSTGPEPATKF